jgi:hypothetical protein
MAVAPAGPRLTWLKGSPSSAAARRAGHRTVRPRPVELVWVARHF